MAKKGRPKWLPPNLKEVEALAAQGLTQKEIAYALGVALSTLQVRKKDFSEFSDALKKGQAKGIAKIANALFQAAIAGNITAQIFYLKTRAGWEERVINEHTGLNGGPIEHRGYVVVVPQEAESIDEWATHYLEAPTRPPD